jgi:hypothetical protein
VKAHTGIPLGNELVDEAARHAMRLTQYCPDDMQHCSTDPQRPSHTQFWPVPADTDGANDDVERRPKQYIGNLGKDLKQYLHEKHRLGYSNTASVYYQAWARTVNIAFKGHRNLLMQSNRADPQDRVTTLHYIYGGLNTAKSTTPHEGSTHSQLSPVGATRGGHHSMSART